MQVTRVVTHHGRFKAGIAGGLLECSGCGRPLSVSGDPRMTYSCRRVRTTGCCPRPVHVSKDAADRFVIETLVDALDGRQGFDLVASARELEAARRDCEEAKAQKEAFVRLADALDEADFRAGYEERRSRESETQEAYDELLARVSEVDDLPKDGSAFRRLDAEAQRRVARSLIAGIVVSARRDRRTPVEERSQSVSSTACRWTAPGGSRLPTRERRGRSCSSGGRLGSPRARRALPSPGGVFMPPPSAAPRAAPRARG